jgi:hypothetical protein
MVYDLITVRGTGEPQDGADTMLTLVTSKLDPARFHFLADCVYPASIGVANQTFNPTGPSEDQSVAAGIANIATLIRSTSNQVGLLGYSLGAEVVSKFLEAQAAGQYSDCQLAFSACVANPLRRVGDSIDPNPQGYGINGMMQCEPPNPHFECANPNDGITSCPADSPLRDIADAVSAFGLAAIGGWSQDLVNRLLERRWQPANWGNILHPVKTWETYQTAADLVGGYLTGQHTTVYSQGLTDRLADVINRVVD